MGKNQKPKQLREIGPIPFLLYINDLPNCLQFSQTRMYADDNSLTFAGTDVNHLNGPYYDRSKVYTWLSANNLTSNLAKTLFPIIGGILPYHKACAYVVPVLTGELKTAT